MKDIHAERDAQSHEASLSLLEEVADYLGRLPPHPMTHLLRDKVLAHLEDPAAIPMRLRLEVRAKSEKLTALIEAGVVLEATGHFHASGVPKLLCQIRGSTLHLASPLLKANHDAEKRFDRSALMDIGEMLTKGVDLELHKASPAAGMPR